MIELENLNNRSLEDILDEAKKQILYLSTEWTNFQEPDPGITLVELFSWLKFVQHEYLNRMSPGVKLKFLKLLDVIMHQNKGSETLLEVSDIKEDVNVPVRTQWKAGDMTFENLHNQTLIKSKIMSVLFENPEFKTDEEYYKFDGSRVFYVFGKDISRKKDNTTKRSFTINFDSELQENRIINLYFSVYAGRDLQRNPIEPSDYFEDMAKVKWEYYGHKNGRFGWYDLEIIRDDTHNFLFSGIIKMRLGSKSQPSNGQCKIRATLLYDEYDYPPRIKNIRTNVFRAVQNQTLCENVVIKKADISESGELKIDRHLALYGSAEVYYKKNDGWVRYKSVTFKKDVNAGELTVDVSKLAEHIKSFADDEEVLMFVLYDKKITHMMTLGSGTGMSAQTVPMNEENVLYSDFGVMIAEKNCKDNIFYKWKRVDDFFSSGKYDKHYILDKGRKIIIFGDHIHGMAPRVLQDSIKLSNLRTTFGENSNTKEGMINAVVTSNAVLKKARITQIKPATGGIDAETLNHAESRAAELFSNPGRAVNLEDYEEVVRETPGLMFTNVKILPNYMEDEDTQKQNCITVAVRWNRKVGLTLPKSYEQNIMHQIDRYRLINTKVKVVAPEYVGLIIRGEIVVDSFYRENEGLIEKEIEHFVEDLNQELGQPLRFGDLFGMIDRLKYVSHLSNLKITPVGKHIQKNVSEDVIIPPNGVYYIQKLDLSYIKNSEIYRS